MCIVKWFYKSVWIVDGELEKQVGPSSMSAHHNYGTKNAYTYKKTINKQLILHNK